MQEILLIGSDGKRIGKMIYRDARDIAKKQNLDLIQVDKDKGIFKLGDAGKLKYDKKRKHKKQKEQKKSHKIKEIQLRPTIDKGDLDIKMRRARKFLEDGMKTRITMKFKKQQMLYRDAGMKKMNEIIGSLIDDGFALADNPPKFEGRNISVFLSPGK